MRTTDKHAKSRYPNERQKNEIPFDWSSFTALFLSSFVSYFSKNSMDLNTLNKSTKLIIILYFFVFQCIKYKVVTLKIKYLIYSSIGG